MSDDLRDAPPSYRLPKARGRVLGRPAPLTWPALALAVLLGAGVFWLAGDPPGRAVGSYVVTVVVVACCFGVASLNVRFANRISPGMALAAAMFSYAATVLLMLIALAAASPRVVDPVAVLVGCCVTVVVWIAGLLRASWVR